MSIVQIKNGNRSVPIIKSLFIFLTRQNVRAFVALLFNFIFIAGLLRNVVIHFWIVTLDVCNENMNFETNFVDKLYFILVFCTDFMLKIHVASCFHYTIQIARNTREGATN